MMFSMERDIQISICPQCGSTVTGSLFCKNCGAALRTVAPLIASAGPCREKSRGFWRKRDAGWILFGYSISFLSWRFDMLGHHHWFQHPMPTLRAAWVAIFPTILLTVLYKIRFPNKYWER
jgi:hypothetical protein